MRGHRSAERRRAGRCAARRTRAVLQRRNRPRGDRTPIGQISQQRITTVAAEHLVTAITLQHDLVPHRGVTWPAGTRVCWPRPQTARHGRDQRDHRLPEILTADSQLSCGDRVARRRCGLSAARRRRDRSRSQRCSCGAARRNAPPDAAMIDESTPPLRNRPTGTSPISCRLTAESTASRTAPAASDSDRNRGTSASHFPASTNC